MEPKAQYFFELSWEICNKVGGIYTVVKSKILSILKYYKDRYYAVGPYEKTDEFKDKTPPQFLQPIFRDLSELGILCHFGTWLIDGEPNTILIDFSGFAKNVNNIKKDLYDNFKIDSLGTDYFDYDKPILWSYAAGILIEKISQVLKKNIVVQCHEWLSGGALLYLKSRNVKAGTIFTTHATMLGRTLASNHFDLYENLDKIDPVKKAYEYNIQAKFLTEKACANAADVFTTVSEITGIEATYLLGKKPDILLPNGLDIERFPTLEDANIQHKLLKGKLKRFCMFYFFPYYAFDLDNTLFYFIAGRYEFRDKGIDVFIDALAKLNEKLVDKTIVAFIWVPAGSREIKSSIIENRTLFEDINDSIHDVLEDIKDRIVYGIVGNKRLSEKFLLGERLYKQLSRKLHKFKKQGNPPVCTHNLFNEQDEIISALKRNNLDNSKSKRVKVIYYPIYLTGADQLTDLNYYEAIMSCHLGAFPSYYEPWGYTPLETGALGVASLTTDLTGFGRYIKDKLKDKNPGIFVIERKSYEETVNKTAEIFLEYANLSKQDRIQNKVKAKKLASLVDWNILVENYIKAHNMAIDKNSQ